MTFFVDANVVVYGWVESRYRAPCLEILESIAEGSSDGRTSTAVLEEVWHIELSGRAGDLRGLTEHAYTLFTPLLPVTDETFRLALSLDTRHLGPNDRLHVATCLMHDIESIATADAGFDRAPGVRRVDPLNERARRRMLRA